MNENILKFYLQAITLKNVDRTGWKEVGVTNVESVMDHIGGTVTLAMAINAEKNLGLNMSKVYNMIIIKELKKSVSKIEVSITQEGNTDNSLSLLNTLSNNEELIADYNELLEGTTREAKFAEMVAKFESDIQAKKYEMDGEFTLENAKNDIENYPEDIKSRLTDIQKASEGWLEYDKQFYDEMFAELSDSVSRL